MSKVQVEAFEREGETPVTTDGKPPAPAEQLRDGIRALLVEDDDTYARLVARALQRSSGGAAFTLFRVGDLGEAFAALKQAHPDVIVLDLNLPDSSGLDTLLRIRAAHPDTAVVVLTGLDDEELGMQTLQAGAQDYVVKGGDPGLISRAIRYAVERSQNEARLRRTELALRDAQLQLLQSEKLDSLGSLAAGFAHEIKNPLAVLQMGLELWARRKREDDTEAAEALSMMEKAVERASSIVQRLLSFAAPAGAARHLTSINSIIEVSREMVRHELGRRDVTLVEELSPDLPELLLDAASMQQAIVNLLMNAIQASPPGGTVTVCSSRFRLDQPGAEAGRGPTKRLPPGMVTVQCEILDEGPGLSAEVQRRLYHPFFTTKQQGEGTGLGLYVTRNIVELHGGRLSLGNRPDGGTRAVITLVP